MRHFLAECGFSLRNEPEYPIAIWALGLNPDYPMVDPAYAAKRQELAKKIGLERAREVICGRGARHAAAQNAMTTVTEDRRAGGQQAMRMPPVVSTEEWEAARARLLVKEKELTRARDALAAERRRMPWLAVETDGSAPPDRYHLPGPRSRSHPADWPRKAPRNVPFIVRPRRACYPTNQTGPDVPWWATGACAIGVALAAGWR